MSWLTVFSVTVLAALCYGGAVPVVKHLHRNVRAISNSQLMLLLESRIITECKENTHNDSIQKELQETFAELKKCLGKKLLYLTPKDEYMQLLDTCSEKIVKETTECLPPNHKYLPGLLKQYAKNMFEMMYDDFDIIVNHMGNCLQDLSKHDAERSFMQCISDAEYNVDAHFKIPDSKEEYCKQAIPPHRCFGNTVRKYCTDNVYIEKYVRDYNNVLEDLCPKTTKNV